VKKDHTLSYMNGSIEVRSYSSLRALENLRPAWNRLLAETPNGTAFNSWEWLVPWWHAFAKNQELLVLAFWNLHGDLVGLAPLEIHTSRIVPGLRYRLLRFMGDGSGDSDNLDFLIRPGYEAQVTRSFFDYLDVETRSWDCCQLNTIPDESASLIYLLQQLNVRRWRYIVQQRPRSAIPLPDSWDSYENRISKKERRKLRYYRQRITKTYAAQFHKCSNKEELRSVMDAFFALHEKRWRSVGEPGTFVSTERRQFYQELANSLLERDWLDFWLLNLNGKMVAAQFGFRYRDTVYALQEGFDPDYAGDSVGFVLRGHVLREAIAEQVQVYDFLATANKNKLRFGARTAAYLDVHFAQPDILGSNYIWLAHLSWSTKRWLRKELPPSAWSVLHKINLHLRSQKS
jgi:CelD/BcsL family acetyltransferase involved in cellulose biosynthesis